jgi:hypothetical protein
MADSRIEAHAKSISSSLSQHAETDPVVAAIKDDMDKILDLLAPGVIEREPPAAKSPSTLVDPFPMFRQAAHPPLNAHSAFVSASALFESTKQTGSRKAQRLAYSAKRLAEASMRLVGVGARSDAGSSFQPVAAPRKAPATEPPFPHNEGIRSLQPDSDVTSILMDVSENLDDIDGR